RFHPMRISQAVVWLLTCYEAFADSLNTTNELIDRLFKDYNAQASPYVRREGTQGSSHAVSLRLNRAIIASVNERDWTVSILVSLNYKWIDPRLAWDPATADGVSGISMKSEAVWLPDVYPWESQKISPVFKDLTKSVIIAHDGSVYSTAYQVVNYICQMKFDAFPFDTQDVSMGFTLDGLIGTSLTLVDLSPQQPEIISNSEWDVEGEITREEYRTEQDGVQSHRIVFHFTLVRRAFFWIFLIIIPTLLFCLVTLVGIFFYEGDDAVQNAASIGLTTMTSLMLVVTILSDALDKSDNLPGLGWFVFVEISVVCLSVIALLIFYMIRSGALKYSRNKQDRCKIVSFLTSKRVFRAAKFTLFLLAIVALVLNTILCWN
ncbi:hypothetical protein PMAYCL1PPCAC_14957, partial [Pristionchus mayeri]